VFIVFQGGVVLVGLKLISVANWLPSVLLTLLVGSSDL